ncbi:MAG: ABC transporter ATP-binding protein/permease [Clostridiales bacterium]|nr:ABC transporter ATP-binding protein/permease [Clostridiales bacterium]
MLRLQNVDKYFYRRKPNEIHVINDTSLEFGESGLIALLGPSGCGKTTLLNVIGGLDRPDSGNIYINDKKISGRSTSSVDKIRNLNIGYIFQNYNLIDNKTVFENVAMVLRMVGIKDKNEIREKVEYALGLVGMYRYRKRYADMLSGGERQRVAIARAIVKDPAIIIADEPTGNLDSSNTLEVMNIIKAISREKLVILVTHEEELADFYADRIIRLRDGVVISDEVNANVRDLDYRIENRIYLKDIEDCRGFRDDDYSVRVFNESGGKMNLDIVISRGNIFIHSRDSENRMEIVDDNSSIELVDDHYRALSSDEAEARKFDPEKLRASKPLRHSSIVGPYTMLRDGFRSVGSYHRLKKILLIGFFLAAIFISYAVYNIGGILNMPDEKFVKDDMSYVQVVKQKIAVDEYLKYESDPSVEYALPGPGQVNARLLYDEYWQTYPGNAAFAGSVSSADDLDKGDLVSGRLPEKRLEVVVDGLILERIKESDPDIVQVGFRDPEELIGRHLSLRNLPDLTIVGITDKNSPCIYVQEPMMIDVLAGNVDEDSMYEDGDGGTDEDSSEDAAEGEDDKAPFSPDASALLDYSLYTNDFELTQGSAMPENDYEVIVDKRHSGSLKIGKEIKTKINGHKLKVVGFYTSDTLIGKYLVNTNTIKYRLILDGKNMIVKPRHDKDETISALSSYGVKARDLYSYQKSKYRKAQLKTIRAFLIVGGIILIISLVEVFLMMRASFMSRIKEVGTLRAIGVKKSDIYRMFTGEIIAITVMSSVPGWLLITYIIYKMQDISFFKGMFMCDPRTMLISLALIFAFNLIFGLLPAMHTLIRRPAEILARTDVN